MKNKTTSTIEAARWYLEKFRPKPVEWKLLNREHRIWMGIRDADDRTFKSFRHICKPRYILHLKQGKNPDNLGHPIGTLVEASYWHTKAQAYVCFNCKRKFEGTVAFTIDLIRKGEGLTS